LIVVIHVFEQEAIKARLARYKEQTEKLIFQRLKEPLDLPVRLRMPDCGLAMADVSEDESTQGMLCPKWTYAACDKNGEFNV
jgi:hypothetical protein